MKERRMPKGWALVGTSEIYYSEKTYTEKYRDMKSWYKVMLEAEKNNKKLVEDMKSRKLKKRKTAEGNSNAEDLIEKKYHKEKSKKIS